MLTPYSSLWQCWPHFLLYDNADCQLHRLWHYLEDLPTATCVKDHLGFIILWTWLYSYWINFHRTTLSKMGRTVLSNWVLLQLSIITLHLLIVICKTRCLKFHYDELCALDLWCKINPFFFTAFVRIFQYSNWEIYTLRTATSCRDCLTQRF